MIYKKIPLMEGNENAYLTTYVSDKINDFTRDAILVIPGGGYTNICQEREGEAVAQAFVPYGYNAFVLNYSVRENGKVYPSQLIEASLAIKHIKDNAEEYGINPDRIFVCGFSAGGHLCGSLGTMWHKKEIYDAVEMPFGYNKPTGIMLIYPVISADFHEFTFKALLNKDQITDEDNKMCSIEKNVDENSAPAFILHTVTDQVVDVHNSLAVAKAYADINKPFEMHIYPEGPHGVALGNKITRNGIPGYENAAIAKWIEHAAMWAESIK